MGGVVRVDGLGLRVDLFLFLDLDFLLERVLQVLRRPLELVEAAAEGLAEFRELARPEDDQRNHQDNDELGHADGTKHFVLPCLAGPAAGRAGTSKRAVYRNPRHAGAGSSVSISLCARDRFWRPPPRFLCPPSWAGCGARVRSPPPNRPRALQDLHHRAGGHRGPVRRAGGIRSPGLRRHQRHAADARSAFELHGSRAPTRRCASARKAATTASASPSSRSTATSPSCACSRARRRSRGHPPRRRHRRGRGRSAKGWTTEQTVRQAARARRAPSSTSACGAGLRSADRAEGDARRDQHPEPVGASFMIDAHDRLHRRHRLRRDTDEDLGDALETLTAKGMKRLVLDLRDNPGGPLDQAIRIVEPLPAARLDDRLHARARAELRPGLPRHRDERVHDLPMVMLVNRNSASASEIVSRRAAGPRPRARRRRDDVRQGARAVGLPRQRRRRPGADHRALLHAERPPDPAPVGRHLRRVPDLHAAGPGRARPHRRIS